MYVRSMERFRQEEREENELRKQYKKLAAEMPFSETPAQLLRTQSTMPEVSSPLQIPKGIFRTRSDPEGLVDGRLGAGAGAGEDDDDDDENNGPRSPKAKSFPRGPDSRWSMKNCANCQMVFVGEGTCCTNECSLCLELREHPSKVAHLVETTEPHTDESPLRSGYASYDVWNVSPADEASADEISFTRYTNEDHY